MPLKQEALIYILNKRIKWLKMPAGWRQTSWLFTKRDRGFELETTEKQIPLLAEWRT